MRTTRFLWVIGAAFGCLLSLPAQLYDFTVIAPPSGTNGNLSLSANTEGTLVGNYNPDTNPTGTRTKPGLFGPFGPTENVPVNIRLGAQIGGAINRQTGGTFRATVDPSLNLITFSNLSLNFLANGAATLPVSITLAGESFRTRNPTSIYILPSQGITLPIGSLTLSQFSATQTGAGAGVLTPTGPDQYDFTAGVQVDLTVMADLLGNPLGTTVPFVLPLQGSLTLSGNTATITALQTIAFDQTFNPNVQLPAFEYGLPTILPPGSTAYVIFNLTLNELGFSTDIDLNLLAQGDLVPEPASGWLIGLALGSLLAGRRRRAG
ncbi:MAG: PEP-CTERM sorting domain-containing protein [Fimbriimonadales bacterium]|nr:PEP-CTERM sorting domain-containing protein [Fimbriimonadales bacterium]